MSEYRHVGKPFLDQLAGLGWEVVRGWMFEICILCFCGLW
jgi:hypothetical protein